MPIQKKAIVEVVWYLVLCVFNLLANTETPHPPTGKFGSDRSRVRSPRLYFSEGWDDAQLRRLGLPGRLTDSSVQVSPLYIVRCSSTTVLGRAED